MGFDARDEMQAPATGVDLGMDPMFDELYGDPRMDALLARLELQDVGDHDGGGD